MNFFWSSRFSPLPMVYVRHIFLWLSVLSKEAFFVTKLQLHFKEHSKNHRNVSQWTLKSILRAGGVGGELNPLPLFILSSTVRGFMGQFPKWIFDKCTIWCFCEKRQRINVNNSGKYTKITRRSQMQSVNKSLHLDSTRFVLISPMMHPAINL